MHKQLLISVLLVICHQTFETNAKECIDMDVHAREVVSCCRFESFSSEAAEAKCYRELNPQMFSSSPEFILCFIDCVFREMGFLTGSNEIDVQKYVTFHAEFDKDYQIVIAKAVNYCTHIQNEYGRYGDKIKAKCDAFALLFQECVTQFTLKNCPADRWTASEICEEVRIGAPLCT